jgi:hypothetical protein
MYMTPEELQAKVATLEAQLEEAKKLGGSEADSRRALAQQAKEAKESAEASKQALEAYKAEQASARTAELDGLREKRMRIASQGSEERYTKLKTEYGVLNMPESNADEIEARLTKAFGITNAVSASAFTQPIPTQMPQQQSEKNDKVEADYKVMFPDKK